MQWKPPYSSLNSDNIHVDPHITQYTVYITDNYTGISIVNMNITETRFTFNASENDLCPMYQVSAWNAGGESGLSETVQEHSKLPMYSPFFSYIMKFMSKKDKGYINSSAC